MLRIAIDGNEANVSHRVGSNVYAYEVIKALYALREVSAKADVTVLLSMPAGADMPAERPGWSYQVVKPKPFWTQFGLPLYLWFHPKKFDVFYTPGHYAPRWSPIRYISSVMDLAYYEYPEQFRPNDLIQLRDWTAYSVRRASKVVAISRATKKALHHYFPKTDGSVVIGYPALADLVPDLSSKEGKTLEKKLGLVEPYLVYIGTLQPRKNLVRLLHALEIVCKKLQTNNKKAQLPQLVIAGKVGWLAEEILATVERSPFKKQIILAGYVDEAEKQYLLQHARAAVLVGLYEGFGIPALEALRLGTVPVVSNTTSLPEVVGKAGILVDPCDEADIADGLSDALSMSSRERAQFRKLGREQVKKFSWSETAAVVWKAMREVA